MGNKIRYIPDNHKPEDESHIITFVDDRLNDAMRDRRRQETHLGKNGINVSDVSKKVKAINEPLFFDRVALQIYNR